VVYRLIRRFVLSHAQPVSRARIAVPVGLAAVVWVLGDSILKDVFTRLAAGSPPPRGWIVAALALVPAVAAAAVGAVAMRCRVSDGGDVVAQHRVVERCFARLQILTACYISFAHGANDVANAIGPIVGILHATRGTLCSQAAIPTWLLAVGGVGIVTGLATYGYKVINSVGFKITEIIPTRGFSADFSTATTVLICSLMGLPISTTFVLVGAVMGVGLARGFAAIDLHVVRRIFTSWFVTIPASAALAVAFTWGIRLFGGD
jgi:PiT family inorganic phosphate transporter